jgi:hypothetical protein
MKKVLFSTAFLVCAASKGAVAPMLDGVTYTNIQPCVDAAASSTPATCVVPTSTANTSQVEMVSGVTLEFSSGTFTNSNLGGGVFIHFGRDVTGATVRGQGVANTLLRNNSSGPQFGAVVQDEGTGNTVSDMTLDGNNNTTGTLIVRQTTRGRYQNLKVLQNSDVAVAKIVGNGVTATATCVANCFPPKGFGSRKLVRIAGNSVPEFNDQFIANGAGATTFTFASSTKSIGTGGFVMPAFVDNAIDVEGGSEPTFSNIETVGGPQDGFSITTEDLNSNWGDVTGGRYTNIYAHDSPNNGFSINALGAVAAGKTITGIVISGLRAVNNGFVGSGPSGGDDMSCAVLVANLTKWDNTSISGVSIDRFDGHGCGGAGFRLKGRVTKCHFSGTVRGNGLRQNLGNGQSRDGIVLLGGADVGPTNNHFTFSGDKGKATNVFTTDKSTSGNTFALTSGDPVSLGTSKDSGTKVNAAGHVVTFGR